MATMTTPAPRFRKIQNGWWTYGPFSEIEITRTRRRALWRVHREGETLALAGTLAEAKTKAIAAWEGTL